MFMKKKSYAFLKAFFCFDTTSKITAARRTDPLTARCQFMSTPRIDIPLFSTPIKIAPTTAPPTVPVPPYADAPPIKQEAIASIS